MNQDYIKPDNWSIIEEGFDAERVKSSESLFSIGMVQWDNVLILKNYYRRNFSRKYIAGIYYQIKQSGMVEKWLS
jgi:maltose phosphorylase